MPPAKKMLCENDATDMWIRGARVFGGHVRTDRIRKIQERRSAVMFAKDVPRN